MLPLLRTLLLFALVRAAVPTGTPRGWSLTEGTDVPPQQELEIAIALTLDASASAKLQESFEQVSEPTHARYGQHLSAPQLEALLRSEWLDSCRTAVSSWLRDDRGMAATAVAEVGVDALHVRAPLPDIVRSLSLSPMRTYHRTSAGNSPATYRSEAQWVQLPASLRPCVAAVSGVLSTELPLAHPTITSLGLAARDKPVPTTWPAVLAKMYELPVSSPNGTGSRQATANFIGQYYAQSDLDTFFTTYYPSLAGVKPPLVGPGINDPSQPGSEASLDLQYIMSSASASISTEFWSSPKSESLFPCESCSLFSLVQCGRTGCSEHLLAASL